MSKSFVNVLLLVLSVFFGLVANDLSLFFILVCVSLVTANLSQRNGVSVSGSLFVGFISAVGLALGWGVSLQVFPGQDLMQSNILFREGVSALVGYLVGLAVGLYIGGATQESYERESKNDSKRDSDVTFSDW